MILGATVGNPHAIVADDRHAELLRKVQRATELRFSAVGFFAMTIPGIGDRWQAELVRVLREEQTALVGELLALLEDDRGGGGD